jgi:hypothetical protein
LYHLKFQNYLSAMVYLITLFLWIYCNHSMITNITLDENYNFVMKMIGEEKSKDASEILFP